MELEMKKSDPRWNDNRITPSSGNVFTDLGFDEAEAKVLALRAELMVRLSQELKAKGWTQAQAAKPMAPRRWAYRWPTSPAAHCMP